MDLRIYFLILIVQALIAALCGFYVAQGRRKSPAWTEEKEFQLFGVLFIFSLIGLAADIYHDLNLLGFLCFMMTAWIGSNAIEAKQNGTETPRGRDDTIIYLSFSGVLVILTPLLKAFRVVFEI